MECIIDTNVPKEMYVIDSISGKWTVMIVHTLSIQTRRHSELKRLVTGISDKVLTQTLRRLERDGIVKRTVYPIVPPQVEYSLTPLGISLIDMLSRIRLWAREHYPEVHKSHEEYDNKRKEKVSVNERLNTVTLKA